MSHVVPLLKFTPSAQDPQILETITVQRESLIARLVEVALEEAGGRHQLLIGPRGMGKTHILSLVASRVRARSSTDSVVVAWLEEDAWGVGSYGKFLAAIVDRVAAEKSDEELAAKADELHAVRDDGGQQAEQVLRDAVGDSRLVLLVENLDDVFRRIGDQGQERFRAFVENWQRMVVIATAPRLFEDIQLHESPFYGFFAITHLEELSLDSATELMKRVAELRGDEGLVRFLGSSVARRRLAAIEALAGGHPRIWLLLSGCVSIKAIDELVPLFLQALDDLTPYYQDRLRELGDQQQEVVVLLSEAGGALSNRALAERSGIPQNQIATILRQLSTRGYVRRAEVPEWAGAGDARMSFWELREPLMRLCLDVKQARGRPLRMVVEFLRAWYGPRLLDELVRLPADASLAATYAGEAFRTWEGDLPTDDLLRGSPAEIVSRAERGLELKPERIDLGVARATGLLLGQRYDQARTALDELLAADLPSGPAWAVRGLREVADNDGQEIADADLAVLELVEKAEFDTPGMAAMLARSYKALDLKGGALTLFRKAAALAPEDVPVLRSYGILAGETEFYEEALEALTTVRELQPEVPGAHTNRSIVLRRLGRIEEAIAEAHEAVRLGPDNAIAHDALGSALGEVGEFEEALAAGETAAALAPDNARILGNLAATLDQMGRSEEALEVFGRAVAMDPENSYLRVRMGLALSHLGRRLEALQVIEKAVEFAPGSAEAHSYLGKALTDVGRHEEALAAFAEASEIEPDDPLPWRNKLAALTGLLRFEEALEAIERALALEPENPEYHQARGVALFNLGRFDEGVADVERAIALEPENPAFLSWLARFLEHLGRLDEALAQIAKAVELSPDDPELCNLQADTLRQLDRLEEAEAAAARAIELDPDEGVYLFTWGEVALARQDVETALDRLRSALRAWATGEGGLPGETDVVCQIVWERYAGESRRRELIREIVQAYEDFGALEELGAGLVSSIPLFLPDSVDQEQADRWVADWSEASGGAGLKIPLKLLKAARAWKEDHDRAHLLGLPAEQREVLAGLLEEAQ